MAHRPNLTHHLYEKVLWEHKVVLELPHLCIYGCFCTIVTEVSSHGRDHMACET